MTLLRPFIPRFKSCTSSQPPAHVDQCTSGTDMSQRPRQRDVGEIRRIVDEQLRDDMIAQQVDNLRVIGGKDLGESCSKRKG